MMKVGSKSPQPAAQSTRTGGSAPVQSSQARGVSGSAGPSAQPAWEDPRAAARQSVLRMPNSSSQPTRGSDTQVALDLGQGEQFQVTKFNTKVNEVQFSQQPGAGKDMMVQKQPLGDRDALGAHEKAGVFLGWKSGQGELMDLSQASKSTDFFATAPMNGCALVVGGSQKGPTLMHANYDSDRLRSSTDHDHQLGVYKDAYGKISQQAVAGGHIPQENLMVFDPSHYLQKGSGVSAVNVFGTKGEDGNWTLHYSAKKQTTEQVPPSFIGSMLGYKPQSRTTTEVITGELWPNPDLSALQGK